MPTNRELQLLVQVLRVFHGGSQADLAAAAGVSENMVYRYESALSTPPLGRLARMAAAARVPLPLLDGLLLPAIRLACRLREAPSEEFLKTLERAAEAVALDLREVARASFAPLVTDGTIDEEPRERRSPVDLWRRLEPRTDRERRLLIEGFADFQSPELSEYLCAESARAAAHRADLALELAGLALKVAEHASGKPAFRSCLQGYAWGFVANAHRVSGNLPAAEVAFATAWKRWREGAGAESGLVAEWRLLDLEAVLHCAQRRWPEALELHERARSAAPAEALPHVLLNKASTLEQADQIENAVATLREGAPLLDGSCDRRLGFGLRFNLATNLCHLDRYAEAEESLPEVRRLAAALGNELDLIRVRWLTGRIAAGQGRSSEAYMALDLTQKEFATRGIAYDAALVSLELASILLDQGEGHAAKVQELAAEMVQIFESQQIHREALAALALFYRAVQEQTATVAMARRLLKYLERARHRPDLRFEKA